MMTLEDNDFSVQKVSKSSNYSCNDLHFKRHCILFPLVLLVQRLK